MGRLKKITIINVNYLEQSNNMNDNQKIMAAIGAVVLMGVFIFSSSNKDDSAALAAEKTKLLTFSSMQGMASQKCPVAIKNETGTEVNFASSNESDKDTYVTLFYKSTEKSDNFKNASCTLTLELGGISKLIIDDKVVIDRKKMTTTNN
jgi:hypothetical protein